MCRRSASLLFVPGLLLALGCAGPQEESKYVPVTGKVTYKDGTPIPASRIVIQFHPYGRGSVTGATGEVNVETGEFHTLTSESFGDGIARGRHRVTLIAFDGNQLSRAIPSHYATVDETPLKIDTNKPGSLELEIDKPGSAAAKAAQAKRRKQNSGTRVTPPATRIPPTTQYRGDSGPANGDAGPAREPVAREPRGEGAPRNRGDEPGSDE